MVKSNTMRRDLKSIRRTKLARSSDWPLYRRFLVLITIILLLLLGAYFAGLFLLSNLNIFWGTVNPNGGSGPKDTIAPSPPTIFSLPEATNSAALNVKGFAEPGGTVILFVNESQKDTQIADKEGRFSFNDLRLETGENRFGALVKDSSENESRTSTTQTVVFDKEPPKLEVNAPEDGDTVSEEKGKQTFVNVSGNVDGGAKVTVNGNLAIIREEGKFEHRLLLTEEGENTIKIEAKDAAGNKTVVEKTIIFKKLEAQD